MPGLPEDARPVGFLSITDRDRARSFAWFKDPDGNILSVTQYA